MEMGMNTRVLAAPKQDFLLSYFARKMIDRISDNN